MKPVIKPLPITTNQEVKRQIVSQNIKNIEFFQCSLLYRKCSWDERRYYSNLLFRQKELLVSINKKIKELSQLNFRFGSIDNV